MPIFRFKLEPLLTARKQEERSAQLAVAALERQRMALEDTLRRHQQNISVGKQELRDRLVGDLDMPIMRDHAVSTVQLLRLADRTVLQLAGVYRQTEQARAVLIEATKRRRAVELLRERRLKQWKQNLQRAEDAALDELAVQRAGREEPF